MSWRSRNLAEFALSQVWIVDDPVLGIPACRISRPMARADRPCAGLAGAPSERGRRRHERRGRGARGRGSGDGPSSEPLRVAGGGGAPSDSNGAPAFLVLLAEIPDDRSVKRVQGSPPRERRNAIGERKSEAWNDVVLESVRATSANPPMAQGARAPRRPGRRLPGGLRSRARKARGAPRRAAGRAGRAHLGDGFPRGALRQRPGRPADAVGHARRGRAVEHAHHRRAQPRSAPR